MNTEIENFFKTLDYSKCCNLYICETPFQHISALEAKYRFKSETNILIYFSHKSNKTNLNEWDWNYILEYDSTTTQGGFNFILLLKRLKKIKITNLFLGDYRNFNFRITASYLKSNSTYFLDDGCSTIYIQQQLIANTKPYSYSSKKHEISQYFRLIKRGMFHVFPSHKNHKPNLFTYYDKLKPCPHQTIITHSFEYLKSKFLKFPPNIHNESIYFIGFPSEEIFENPKDYIYILNKELKKYPQDKIIYIPHRRETLDTIRELGFEIILFETPAEIAFLTTKQKPKKIIGCFSSVLFHIQTLLPNIPIDSIDIRMFPLKEEFIQELDVTYNYLFSNTKATRIIA